MLLHITQANWSTKAEGPCFTVVLSLCVCHAKLVHVYFSNFFFWFISLLLSLVVSSIWKWLSLSPNNWSEGCLWWLLAVGSPSHSWPAWLSLSGRRCAYPCSDLTVQGRMVSLWRFPSLRRRGAGKWGEAFDYFLLIYLYVWWYTLVNSNIYFYILPTFFKLKCQFQIILYKYYWTKLFYWAYPKNNICLYPMGYMLYMYAITVNVSIILRIECKVWRVFC